MRTNGHRPKGKVNLSNSRTYNAFALTGRIDYNPLIPRVPLRSTLGCALLRFQRVLDNITVIRSKV